MTAPPNGSGDLRGHRLSRSATGRIILPG